MRCFEKWVCIIEKIVLMLKHIEIFTWTNTNAIRDRGQSSSDWVGVDSYFPHEIFCVENMYCHLVRALISQCIIT